MNRLSKSRTIQLYRNEIAVGTAAFPPGTNFGEFIALRQ